MSIQRICWIIICVTARKYWIFISRVIILLFRPISNPKGRMNDVKDSKS